MALVGALFVLVRFLTNISGPLREEERSRFWVVVLNEYLPMVKEPSQASSLGVVAD
jgi:hypothetical protein